MGDSHYPNRPLAFGIENDVRELSRQDIPEIRGTVERTGVWILADAVNG